MRKRYGKLEKKLLSSLLVIALGMTSVGNVNANEITKAEAATEAMTDTEAMTETEVMTEAMTETEVMTEAMTETEVMTAAEPEVVLEQEAATEEQNWDGTTTQSVYEAKNYRVVYTLTDLWDDGYNVSVKVENTGETIIHDWYLSYTSKNEIMNIWNAEIYKEEAGQYIIKHAGWNQDISVGGSVEYGFSGKGNFSGFPEKYEIVSQSVETQIDGYSIEYHVDHDWENGFAGSITIRNNTDRTLEDWVLEFEFDRMISSISNGTIEHCEDNQYAIMNAGYNSNILAGQSVVISFQVDDGSSEAQPYHYKLYTYEVEDDSLRNQEDSEKDSDMDGLPDYMENYFGLDSNSVDTDEDGLSDYIEFYTTWTDPLLKDTNGDGQNDGKEDTDGDGLFDLQEIDYGTDLIKVDTDSDGLSDYIEISSYGTEPLQYDTDGDYVSDGKEIELGTNPLMAESAFQVSESAEEEDSVKVSVSMEVSGEQVESLYVEKVDLPFSEEMSGDIGAAYDFSIDGSFDQATISFAFDASLLQEQDFDPIIYYFNEDTQQLEELDTIVEGNIAYTVVNHFSKYILINRNKLEYHVYESPATFSLRAATVAQDSDYDGRNDSIDAAPSNNKFTGTLKTNYATSNVEFNMDYRWFFKDNTTYNSKLSVISSLLSSAIYHENALSIKDSAKVGTTSGKNVKDIMEFFGLSNVKVYSLADLYTDKHLSEVAIGYRTVSYGGVTKNVVSVIIRGTNGTIEEWSSNFEIGKSSDYAYTKDWKTKTNHAGFDIVANRIRQLVEQYVSNYNVEALDTAYWITGHSRGAAVANILGAYYESAKKRAYTYTFASPNTTMATNTKSYKTIFNVINADDFVPCLPMSDWGYGRYGRTATASIAAKYEKQWENLTGIGDYNPDTLGLQDTVDSLAKIISGDARVQCYKYTCDDHGDGSSDNITIKNLGTSKKSREAAIAKIPSNALPYCKITRYNGGWIAGWDFEVCQTPAYFMQILAAIMGNEIDAYRFTVELNIADRYEDAKNHIIRSYLGGVEDPHYTESYYVLAKNMVLSEFK